MRKKEHKTDIVAIRMADEIRKKLPKGNASEFIKEAIIEKLNRESKLKTCSACKGTGKVRKK